MNTRTFSIVVSLNCNLCSEAYSFIHVDNLSYFYPFESEVSIPIGDSHLVYTYEEDVSFLCIAPDYRLLIDDSIISIWKLD